MPSGPSFLYLYETQYKDTYQNDFISLNGLNKPYPINFMYPNNRPFLGNSSPSTEALIKKTKDSSFMNEKPEKGKISGTGGLLKEEIIKWLVTLLNFA